MLSCLIYFRKIIFIISILSFMHQTYNLLFPIYFNLIPFKISKNVINFNNSEKTSFIYYINLIRISYQLKNILYSFAIHTIN